MTTFRVFMTGCADTPLVDLPVDTIEQVDEMISRSRFLPAEIIDFVDHDGVCSNRRALIAVSRIQMIAEDEA